MNSVDENCYFYLVVEILYQNKCTNYRCIVYTTLCCTMYTYKYVLSLHSLWMRKKKKLINIKNQSKEHEKYK